MRRVLFLVDAGAASGLGHLQRCLSLAAALRRLGTACVFLTSDDPVVQRRVSAHGCELAVPRDGAARDEREVNRALDLAGGHQFDAIVVDSYAVEADDLGRLRETGLVVVAIDDLARQAFPCQFVINGSAHASQLTYRSSSGDTTFLLGLQYALLRPEFWDRPPRAIGTTVDHVLVTLGGADPWDLMPRILSLLDEFPGTFRVTAVVGPFFGRCADVERTVGRCRRRIRLVEAPESVGDLMEEADLAVSAGGQTLYELACVGCPTVAVSVAANQDRQLAALAEAGCLRVAGSAAQGDVIPAVRRLLDALFTDAASRMAMTTVGQRLVDGRGVLRVAQAIFPGGARLLGTTHSHRGTQATVGGWKEHER